jgi:hypothetical protein
LVSSGRTGQITARLDAAGGVGRQVTWSADEFEGFRHGYAGTIYKGQGKTLDRTYLYHTEHWRAAASYVALTRQRESAQVFVARETARDAPQLARQMARGEVRAASVAWATPEEAAKLRAERQAEAAAASRNAERTKRQEAPDVDRLRAMVREALAARQRSNAAGGKPEAARAPDGRAEAAERQADPAAAYWKAIAKAPREAPGEDRLQAKVREALAARQRLNAADEKLVAASAADAPRQAAGRSPSEDERAPAALLPAWRDPTGQGRDSLGRGTSPEDLARVADQDPAVLREADGRKWAMRTIYLGPETAADALDALIKTSGNDLREAARKLEADGPEVLGDLRGREGWLASRAVRDERQQARNVAPAIPASLKREAAARDTAVSFHTAEVDQQRTRDAVEVPGLSRASLAVLEDVGAALRATREQRDDERYDAKERRQEEAVAGAWTAGRADPRVAGELDQFMAAAERRLGEEGMRDASRATGQAGRMAVPGAGPEHQAGLDVLAQSFMRAREGTEQSAAWGNRLGREAQAAEWERSRQEERQRLGLPPETPREQHRQRRGLSM